MMQQSSQKRRWAAVGAGCIVVLTALAAGAQPGVDTPIGGPAIGQELRGTAPEAAQTSDDRPNIDLVEWGWGRFEEGVPAEAFSPLTVWISSGESAWSGTLRFSYNQDRTQRTIISVPVSTTPGRSTPVELTAVFPAGCEGATAELFDTKRRDRRPFATFPSQLELPFPSASASANRVLVVGDSNARTLWERLKLDDLEQNADSGPVGHAPPAWSAWQQTKTTDVREAYIDQILATNVRPDRLPQAWAAYEGVALVILAADAWDRMEPRSRSALQAWVWSGGRVLVEAGGAGNTWANVFPVWAGETPIVLDDQSRISIAGRLMELPPVVALPPPSQKVSEASSARVLARRIQITDRGLADGWRIAWPSYDDEAGGSGVLAVGPAGFGVVGVLSVDPLQIIGMLDSARIRRVWREAILEVAAVKDAPVQGWGWYGASSAPDMETGTALSASLDFAAKGQALGTRVFLLLVAGVAVLALLLGPGDWWVLKRLRKSHLSWASALVWTGLACVFAFVTPSLIRSGGSQYGRVRVVDTIAGEPPVSATTVASGIFGASSRRVKLADEGSGSFTRGVSALQTWSDAARTFGPLSLVQRSSRADPSLRESVSPELGVGQWTFRTLQTQAPARPNPTAISARLEGDLSEPRVVLLNVPVGATIHASRLTCRGKKFDVTFAAGEVVGSVVGASVGRLETRTGDAKPLPVGSVNLDGVPIASTLNNGYPYVTGQTNPLAPSFSMMGPIQRAESMNRRAAHGWAILAVRLSGAGGAVPEDSGMDYHDRTYVRIAVPLPPGFDFDEVSDETDEGSTPP